MLTGGKQFSTNVGLARVNVIFTVTDPARGAEGGISAFIVETEAYGLRTGKIEGTMGIRGSQNGELLLESCVVPVADRIGQERDGYRLALPAFDRARIGIATQVVKVVLGAFEYAIQYTRQRVQFGNAVAEHEGTQFLIVELATQIDAACLLVQRTATLLDTHGAPDIAITQATAVAKLFASDMAGACDDGSCPAARRLWLHT